MNEEEFYKTYILANPCEINVNSKEIAKLKEHCEKQIRLCHKFNDVEHSEEHELVLKILNNYEILQQENNQLKEQLESIDKHKMLLDIISVPVMKMKIEDIEKLPTYLELYEQNNQLKEKVENQRIALGNMNIKVQELKSKNNRHKKEKRRLLKIAKKMHLYIFLNTSDEQKVYDEIGLTDKENAMLGYSGQFILKENK